MMTNLPPLLVANIFQLENCTPGEHPELGNTETILTVYRLRRGLLQEIILNSSSVELLRRSIFSAVVLSGEEIYMAMEYNICYQSTLAAV